MLELIAIQAKNVVGIRISGKIEKADIEKVKKEVEARLAVFRKLRVYVELESFGGISLEALVADLKWAFPHLKNFEKKAVVSEKGWIGKLVGVGNLLVPGIEVRHFTFEEKREALAWAAS